MKLAKDFKLNKNIEKGDKFYVYKASLADKTGQV